MEEEHINSTHTLQDEVLRDASSGILLGSYDDIFSIFDPRPYLSRSLSDDFLVECKRISRYDNDKTELRILIPKDKRNLKDEWKIKKRLKNHFLKHLKDEENKIKKMRRDGFLWVFIGAIINICVVSGTLALKNNFVRVFVELFSVPSWFLIWEGMSKIFISSKITKPDYIFYKKMSDAEISFMEY